MPENLSRPGASPSEPERPYGVPGDLSFGESGSLHFRMPLRSHAWRPPTDVFETEDTICVRVEVAGMNDDDFLIELDGRYLAVRGVRPDTSERRAYHQMEIRFGEFSTEVELPFPVNADQTEAVYENGFLIVKLPKARIQHVKIDE